MKDDIPAAYVTDVDEITPVQKAKDAHPSGFSAYYLKRDDLFSVAGVFGAKARAIWDVSQGADGLVTAGSRTSCQVNIVSHLAEKLGIEASVHVPHGSFTPILKDVDTTEAIINQHKPGYNNVLISRAKDDAEERGFKYIPFGMDMQKAIEHTRKQVANIPDEAERIVVPVGSGMSLAGILHGLNDRGIEKPVIGVVVGKRPEERLQKYAPLTWNAMVDLVDADVDYHEKVKAELGGLKLDPVYEAKCLKFLEPGDLFWLVGIRRTLRAESGNFNPCEFEEI